MALKGEKRALEAQLESVEERALGEIRWQQETKISSGDIPAACGAPC